LSNVLTFYELYGDKALLNNKEKNPTSESKNVLDLWILTRLNEVLKLVTKSMDEYKVLEPVRAIREFIDDLSTWYLRRSRDRIKNGDNEARRTLYFVLKNVAKIFAPFAPFYAESMYQKLKSEDDAESVHLEEWPELVKSGKLKVESQILENMAEVRRICSLGLLARQKANIKVRQPLGQMKVKSVKLKEEKAYLELIKDEVNVKEVLADEGMEADVWLDTNITPELKDEGTLRELIRGLQDFRKANRYDAKDLISMKISPSDELKRIVENPVYQKELKKVVGIDRLEIVSDELKEKHNVDNQLFSFDIL